MTGRLTLPLLVLGLAVGLAACGTKSEDSSPTGPQRLTLLLDFFPNADHAGIYQAVADGEFRRAGLDVKIEVPGDPSAPLRLLQAGRTDLAISYEPEVMLARDKGAKLISIGALVTRPLTSIIALGSAHLRSPAGLEGHTIGTAGIPYQSAYLKTILSRAGADGKRTKEVNVGFNLVPAMLSKRVHATLGGFWNYEGIQLERAPQEPHDHPRRRSRACRPTTSWWSSRARASSPTAGRSTEGSSRRWRAPTRRCAATPIRASRRCWRPTPTSTRAFSGRPCARRCRPSSPQADDQPWGWQEPREWKAYGEWMSRNGLLKRRPDGARAMTDELLPGQGP